MLKPDARPATRPTWCWLSGDVGWTISKGKDLFRQRGCMGCHRYEGYDREPEELQSLSQQIKQMESQKKENTKQSAYLMKQADTAASNEEANPTERRSGRACASPTARSTGASSRSTSDHTA